MTDTEPNYFAHSSIMLQWDEGIMTSYKYRTFQTIEDAQDFIKSQNIKHWSIWKYFMGGSK